MYGWFLRSLAEKIEQIFAVFVVAPIEGGYAATTRPNSKKIGLPGGKVDPGETPREALLRECREEGFEVFDLEAEPFFCQFVEGKLVAWYRAKSCKMLSTFKEEHRIKPLIVSLEEIANSGMGNDRAVARLKGGFLLCSLAVHKTT